MYIIAYKYKNLPAQYLSHSRNIGESYTLTKKNAKSFNSLEDAKLALRTLLNIYEYRFCKNYKAPFYIESI